MSDECEGLPWPQKGDELFRSDADWWNNACLNFLSADGDWHLYAEGYKRAAEILVQHVAGTQSDQDVLVYPIVFAYRQHLELRLKDIIKDAKRLQGTVGEFPRTHDIGCLWEQCRILLEELYPDEGSDDLDATEESINQFRTVDPTSMAFRYPTDRKGHRSVDGLRYINLRNLSEVMSRITTFLDSVCTQVTVDLDMKLEMDSYYSE